MSQLEMTSSEQTIENFMQNNVQQFQDFQEQAKEEMSRDLEKIPLGILR